MISLINPATGLELRPSGNELVDSAANRIPVVGSIPRFCEPENYSASFGLQWNKFAATQLDRSNVGLELNETRFFRATGWNAEELAGQDLLEVGSGAGRFSRVVLERTKARLWSVDYSTAVDANLENNRAIAGTRLNLFQASIYDMPFADGTFDRTFCLGVLQHTPNFEESVRSLIAKTKPGGEIVVDFYPIRGWWTKLNAKYTLRPITRRMAHDRLLGLIDKNIDWLMASYQALVRCRLGVLTRFLPIADLRQILPKHLPPHVQREWAVLDTFDMFSPAYDNPQRVGDVAEMFRRCGATVTFAGYVDIGGVRAAVVRAVRK